jgi:hypothetical protein
MIRKLHEDGETVKAIFDHFRNVGIAGLIIGASQWVLFDIWAKEGVYLWVSLISATLLFLIGLSLFALNFRQGLFQLGQRIPKKSWCFFAIHLIYGLFIFSLLGAATHIHPQATLFKLPVEAFVSQSKDGAN